MNNATPLPRLGLRNTPYPVSSGKPSKVELQLHRWYELTCDVDVLVRVGSGPPRPGTDRLVRPDTPLVFLADVATITVGVATTSPGTVWLRSEVSCE